MIVIMTLSYLSGNFVGGSEIELICVFTGTLLNTIVVTAVICTYVMMTRAIDTWIQWRNNNRDPKVIINK